MVRFGMLTKGLPVMHLLAVQAVAVAKPAEAAAPTKEAEESTSVTAASVLERL